MASLIDLFKNSEFDVADAPDTETFIEQETDGIRVASGVDLNNPVFYGNEAVRIGTRTTRTKDTMLEGTNPTGGEPGLLDSAVIKITGGRVESLTDARNKINDFIGIPETLIPTRVADKIQKEGKTVQQVIDEREGTEFGKFLKQTGGGNLDTIGKQALGQGIGILKDKARTILFGTPLEPTLPQENQGGIIFSGDPAISSLWGDTTYTEYQNEFDYRKEDLTARELQEDSAAKFQVNLANFSPVYGVQRGSKNIRDSAAIDPESGVFSEYSPISPYTLTTPGLRERSLEVKRGLGLDDSGRYRDEINSTPLGDITKTTEELEDLDLIPFWVSRYGADRRIHFRALLTGIAENVSPSWNTNKFFGNPYSFYTYGGVERNVSFNLLIYCMNELELNNNWEKINALTRLTYPTINESNYTNPPIIQFRIGDIYNNKVGLIEALTYTLPDNGTWEIDPVIGLLPKIIEVSLTFKFIEQEGAENSLYNYERSQAATANVNNKVANPITNPVTGVGNSGLGYVDTKAKPISLNITKPQVKVLSDSSNLLKPSEENAQDDVQLGRSAYVEREIKLGTNNVDDNISRVFRRPNSRINRELEFRTPNSTRLV